MRGPSTTAKIERLLAIVPWVVERGGAKVADIAERFEMPPEAVYELLHAAMCYEVVGAGAYQNLGFVVFGDSDSDAGDAWVHVEPGAMLDRPLDLSARQAFGILVAGQSALALRGADRSGALATALDKLGRAYGERIRVSVDLPLPRSLPTLQAARDARTTVRIHYYTPSTDEVSERRVDPLEVSLHDGHWYLRGWCHLRADMRSFRVDRIEECIDTGEPHDRAARAREMKSVTPAEFDETTDVVLSIPRSDLWRIEAFASRDVVPDGDRCVATYALSSPWVLSQMLLRLGADTRIVNAAELPPELAEAGKSTAATILELYEN